MTLTRISLITGVLIAAANAAVLFGLPLTTDQIAGVSTFLAVLGGAIHSWFNPDVKLAGRKA